MKRDYQVVVVGGGIIGAAVFLKLSAVFGSEVLLIEQARPAAGASAFSGGILRAFHLDGAMSDEAVRGLRFYEELAQHHAGDFSIHRTGFINLIGADELAAARVQFERLAGVVNMHWLSASEAAELLDSPSDVSVAGAVYEPDAGYVDVPALVSLMLRLGVSHGGDVLDGVALQGIAAHQGAVSSVATSCGEIACTTVVMCTGAWTPALAARLGVASPAPLRTKVIQVNRVQPSGSCAALPGFVDLVTGVYGRPDREAMLIGCPVDCWDVDADLIEPPAASQYREVVRRGKNRFRWMDNACVLGGSRRQDAYTASGLGLAAWSPTLNGLLVASGYSGSGVKVAPVAADRVLERVREAQLAAQRGSRREHAHD